MRTDESSSIKHFMRILLIIFVSGIYTHLYFTSASFQATTALKKCYWYGHKDKCYRENKIIYFYMHVIYKNKTFNRPFEYLST